MNMTNTVSGDNIPALTVSAVVDKLCRLYAGAVAKGIPFRKLPTPFLWGPVGVGKSNGVKQLAEKLRKTTGKRVVVTDVRLLLFNPVDLRGLPTANEDKTLAVWLRPQIFQMDPSDDVINLLFLDELSAAPQSVQASAYQICLDRQVGEHRLPDNCVVIAAGNRMTDQSVSYKMPKALCNRLMHVVIKDHFASWKAWAIQNGISDKIIAFLSMDSTRLCAEPTSTDLAFSTPRSWEFVSHLLEALDGDPSADHDLIGACIGVDTAIEFEQFCKGTLTMPSVDKILSGTCSDYPQTNDVFFALVSALTAKIRSLGEDLTVTQLDNLCTYVNVRRFPKEFAVSLFRDLREIETVQTKLRHSPAFQQLLNTNRYL